MWTNEVSGCSTSGVMAIVERHEAVKGERDRATGQERYWKSATAAEAQARAEAALALFLDTFEDDMWDK